MNLEDAVIPVTDPAVTLGWSVFETLWACDGAPWDLSPHLARLEASAAAAGIRFPGGERLRAEVALAAGGLRGLCRVRITLTGGGRRMVVASPLDSSRRFRPITAARGVHRDEPVLGGRVKHGSRAPWVVALARAGVDELLLVDDNGAFTEGTQSAIFAVVGGAICTAPDDGRILASTMLEHVLQAATALGVAVRREPVSADGPWDGLYIANSTRFIAPVQELDGALLPVWDEIGRALRQRLETEVGW